MSKKTKTIAVMQARLNSSRLPGKVLRNLNGNPMMIQIYNRLKQCKSVDEIVLSTSDDKSDDPLVEFAQRSNIQAFRGPLDDIATRMHNAAIGSGADFFARIWCDCPLIAPEVVDEAIYKLTKANLDYISNGDGGFPAGLGVEVYKTSTIKALLDNTKDEKLREFPAVWLKQQGKKIHQDRLKYKEDLSSWYITVDYEGDLSAMQEIYKVLEQKSLDNSLDTLVGLLKSQPELLAAFPNSPRNIEYVEYLKSLES